VRALSAVELVAAAPPFSDTDPLGAVVSAGPPPAALTVSVSDLLPVFGVPSVALTVNVAVPVPVGVPWMTPVEGFSRRPAGSEPSVTLQVYEPVPPVAASVAL